MQGRGVTIGDWSVGAEEEERGVFATHRIEAGWVRPFSLIRGHV
jgi:hypothetical protein